VTLVGSKEVSKKSAQAANPVATTDMQQLSREYTEALTKREPTVLLRCCRLSWLVGMMGALLAASASAQTFQIYFQNKYTPTNRDLSQVFPNRGFQPPNASNITYSQFFIPDHPDPNAPLPNEADFKNYVQNAMAPNPGGKFIMDIEPEWADANNATHTNNRVTLARWAQEALTDPNSTVGIYGRVPRGLHPGSIPEGSVPNPDPINDKLKPIGDQVDVLYPSEYQRFKSFYDWTERVDAMFNETRRLYPSSKKEFVYLKRNDVLPGSIEIAEYNFLAMLFNVKNDGRASGVVLWDEGRSNVTWNQAMTEPWWKAIRKFVGLDTYSREIAVRGNNVVIADGDSTPSTSDHTNFGSVNVSSGSVERTFTIRNLGSSYLTFGLPKLSDYTHFKVTRDPKFFYNHPTYGSIPRMVLIGTQSTTFKIKFDPTLTGTHTITVRFHNNDSNENPFNFTIKGTGK
jgi:hypothetical protein